MRSDRENIMLHLGGIKKVCRELLRGKIRARRKWRGLVVVFKRVVENFCRRMETFSLFFVPPFFLSCFSLFPIPKPSFPLSVSVSVSVSPLHLPPVSACNSTQTPIDLKWHEIKLVSSGMGISFASATRVSTNAPRTRPNYDWYRFDGCFSIMFRRQI